MELRTERLLLRQWRPGDAGAMAAINRDPEVARYLNRPVDPKAFLGVVTAHWKRHGFGFWALESSGALLGFAGVAYPDYIPELAGRPSIAVIHPGNVHSRRLADRLGMHVERSIHNPWVGVDVEVWSFLSAAGGAHHQVPPPAV